MERLFKLKERGTSVKTEFVAGMTTFFAMVYILMVNANMFANPFGDGSNPLGVSYGAIYIATAVSAVVGTVGAGLLSNMPLAQASGMGLNAFFVYTVCINFGLSYTNALVLVLGEGVTFILLTITGLRKKIFDALPEAVRVAIPAGIGLFHWFMQQNGPLRGFEKSLWTGVTTLTLAKAMHRAAHCGLTGLYNLVNNEVVNKYQLLCLFNEATGKGLQIDPVPGIDHDKSLVNTRTDFDFRVPGYRQQILEMAEWIRDHKNLYPHY